MNELATVVEVPTNNSSKNSCEHDEECTCRPEQKIRQEDSYCTVSNDGIYTKYDKYGLKIEQGLLKNGLEEGLWKTFYSDGSVEIKVRYFRGQLNGAYINYENNGLKSTVGHYKNNKMSGKWTTYDEDENLIVESHYSKGIEHGHYTVRFPSGKKHIRGNIVKGENDGLWTMWNENGFKLREELFCNGLSEELHNYATGLCEDCASKLGKGGE